MYADFAAANTMPGLVYEEGAAYGDTPPLAEATLTRTARSWKKAARIDHLAGDSVRLHPGPDLAAKKWHLRVRVDAPSRRSSPAATLLVHKTDGTIAKRRIHLDGRGNGTTTVPFSAATVGTVTVSLANVSTRFDCGRETTQACAGVARDDNQKFTVTTKAVKKATRRH